MNEEMNNGGSVEKTPFYKKNWFVILLIIFIPPAGLIMMWVNKQFGKTARIVLTIVLAIYSIIWLTTLFTPKPTQTTQPEPTTQSQAQPSANVSATAAPTPEPTPAVPTEYKSALKKLNLTVTPCTCQNRVFMINSHRSTEKNSQLKLHNMRLTI